MNSKSLHVVILSFVLSILSACSSSRKITKELTDHLNSETFGQSFTGFALYDIEREEFLLEQNSNKYFIPASNDKLLTFYASIKELGDSIPGIKYYSSQDSLVVWGTGDPSFLNPNTPDSKVLDFLRKSSKNLYLASPPFASAPLGPGWAWDDYNDYYSAERSPFPIYGNVVSFKWNLGGSIPQIQPKYFAENIEENKDISKLIKRELDSNTFDYNPLLLKEVDEINIPFKTSAEITAELLSDTLQKPVTLIPWPSNIKAKTIETLYSVAADSLYKQMLHKSDNFIAEQLLLLISGNHSDTLSTSSAIKHIQSNYYQILPDSIKWVDGSGLSRYNLTTPRILVSVLERIYKEVPKERLFELLPAGAKTGIFKGEYVGDKAFLFAKSGSLSNNYSLSGYLLTKSGKTMIFSFMNNNYMVPTSEIKKAMEMVLLKIRNSY